MPCQAVRAPRSLPLDDAVEPFPAALATTPAEDSDARWLADAVRSLPLTLRPVMLLQLEGFDYKETADLLGISVENVGVRAHRARKQLQALYQEEQACELR